MPEKRNHKRKISRIPVKFGIDAYDKTSYTSNFSTHGFFLRTNRPFVAGTELQFEFRLAGGEVFYVRGQVMHSKRIPSQYARVKTGRNGNQNLGRDQR